MDGLAIHQLQMLWARYLRPLQQRHGLHYDHHPRSRSFLCLQQAKVALEAAANQVAVFLGCNPDEVIFTSGGSESANYAIRGVCSL